MNATETAEALRQSRQLANTLIARGGKDDWQRVAACLAWQRQLLNELAAEEAPNGHV
jgi:hypothetical protein